MGGGNCSRVSSINKHQQATKIGLFKNIEKRVFG